MKVELSPPVERDVVITMTEREALLLRTVLHKVRGQSSAPLSELCNSLFDTVTLTNPYVTKMVGSNFMEIYDGTSEW